MFNWKMKTALSQAEIKMGTELGFATTAEGAWLRLPGHRLLLYISAMLNGYVEEKYILGESMLRYEQSDLMNPASYRETEGFPDLVTLKS